MSGRLRHTAKKPVLAFEDGRYVLKDSIPTKSLSADSDDMQEEVDECNAFLSDLVDGFFDDDEVNYVSLADADGGGTAYYRRAGSSYMLCDSIPDIDITDTVDVDIADSLEIREPVMPVGTISTIDNSQGHMGIFAPYNMIGLDCSIVLNQYVTRLTTSAVWTKWGDYMGAVASVSGYHAENVSLSVPVSNAGLVVYFQTQCSSGGVCTFTGIKRSN